MIARKVRRDIMYKTIQLHEIDSEYKYSDVFTLNINSHV